MERTVRYMLRQVIASAMYQAVIENNESTEFSDIDELAGYLADDLVTLLLEEEIITIRKDVKGNKNEKTKSKT